MTLRLSATDHAALLGGRTKATKAPASARRRFAAAASQARGEAFEKAVAAQPRPPGVCLQRTAPPWRMVRSGAGVRPVVVEAGVPDWHATVDGGAVVFDTKATAEKSWSLSEVDEDQRRHLEEQYQAQAAVGILLRFDLSGRVFWLPWGWFRAAVSRSQTPRIGTITEDAAARVGREVKGMRWWEAAR